MSIRTSSGVRSYRKAALVLAGGSTLVLGAQASASETKAVAAEGAEAATSADQPDESIIVTGERYRINSLNSRLDDIRDAPQSISVIPREVIEQQAAATLGDVLRNVSGISLAAGEGGVPAGDNLTLRGFSARTDIFIDGIRDFGAYTRDTFNVEQVEVVKGPSSAQTGRGSTGGYINLFSKQPQVRTFVGGTVGIGLPDYRRATADINVGEDSTGLAGAALRLNLLYHDADAPGRDFVEGQRLGFAPSAAFGLGTSTRAILSYMLLDQDNLPDYGIPYVPASSQVPELIPFRDRPAPVESDNFYGLVDRDYEETTTHMLTFALEHDVSDAVRLSNITRYGRSTRDSIISAPRFLNSTTTQVRAESQARDTLDRILLNQSNISAEFDTGGIAHDLIAGFELSREKSRNNGRTISEASTTDLFDPDPTRPYDGAILPSGFTALATADSVAGYMFDTLKLGEQWLVSGGIRVERFEVDYIGLPTRRDPDPTPLARTDNIFSWRAGITYKPRPDISLYAGAGTSVNPSFEGLTSANVSDDLALLRPEKSRTYEIGAKWDGFGGKLLVNGALFRIEKINARTPGLPGEPDTVLDGEQRVDGIELGATGWIARRWQLIAAYTYLDSQVRESNDPAELGNRLGNVPKHSGTLWTLYKFPAGIELGAGVRYVGERYTNVANTRLVDDYWLAEATAAYEFRPDVSFRLNLFNLFDEQFVDRVGGGHFIPGPGRSAVATIAFRM